MWTLTSEILSNEEIIRLRKIVPVRKKMRVNITKTRMRSIPTLEKGF